MNDEKKCPGCGADLVWVGSILSGGLECCDGCDVEDVACSGAIAMELVFTEAAPEEDVDANIKKLNSGIAANAGCYDGCDDDLALRPNGAGFYRETGE